MAYQFLVRGLMPKALWNGRTLVLGAFVLTWCSTIALAAGPPTGAAQRKAPTIQDDFQQELATKYGELVSANEALAKKYGELLDSLKASQQPDRNLVDRVEHLEKEMNLVADDARSIGSVRLLIPQLLDWPWKGLGTMQAAGSFLVSFFGARAYLLLSGRRRAESKDDVALHARTQLVGKDPRLR